MGKECPKCQFNNPDDTVYCGKCAAPLKSPEEISPTKTLVTPTQELIGGTTFAGRYQIIEELGRGGMGVVFKAQDTKLKRTVALKFLPPELTHISEVKERFIREAQAAAALDHPHICTVFEFDEAEDKTFISMAYIEGQSLRKKIESAPLELDEALRIATQVAEGLQEAHNRRVVHRDIKSANIMVTEKGQAKIMDFGLARVAGGTLVTKEGMTMGTVAYMSPEQARGEEVNQRTDIWSLGVVLYEMFSGQLPFKGEHDQAVVYSILNEKPESITHLRSEIPVSIEQVVAKALEKNPDERYQNIEELIDDLKSISEGIVPEGIRARLRKAKLLRRKKVILYASIAGLLIIMTVIALSLFTGRAEVIDSIAVLPLENLTGDAGKEYFVDGITDELIGQLGQISALRVISRTSVMQYKESGKSLSEIARELKVDAVVEGSVQQVGESVRIRVQLIDALPEERNLWGQTYDRAMTDVLVMYSEMARAIADEIQVKLLPAEQTRLASAQVVNPEAYDAYLKGSYHWKKLTPAGCDTAQRYFELALENDPSYAPGYEGLAWVWAARQQMGITPPREAGPNSRAAALQAIALDDNSAGAHVALAVVKTWTDWDWAGAQKAWQRALDLNPNDATTQAYYSHFLAIMGRADEAIPHIELALDLDPFNALFHSLYAGILNYHRRYEDAVAAARTALAMQPDAPVAREQLNLALTAQGMHDEKLAAQRERFAHDSELVAALERGLEEAGYEGAQRRIADVLAARYDKAGGFRARTIAELYFDAGDKDLAVDWFEKAYEEHDPNLPYIGRPYWDPLRSDPRFQDLLRRIGLPELQ